MAEKHLIKKWRGQRASYNFLKEHDALSSWTKYTVIETNGNITEYYGDNQISIPTGQLLPVISILSEEPSNPSPYDRYLIGTDEMGYSVIEYTLDKDEVICKDTLPFDEKYGVRVISEGLKNYVYIDGALKTYDDVDCGIF